MDIEEQTAADLVGTPRRVMCLSCLAPIVMEFDPMVSPVIRYKERRPGSRPTTPADTALAQA